MFAVTKRFMMACAFSALAMSATEASALTYSVLHGFSAINGNLPRGTVVADSAGNLYGTTSSRGPNNKGVLYKLATDGTYFVLHSFGGSLGSTEGVNPLGDLVRDSAGNLYGTTSAGGAGNGGTVYKLAPDQTFTVLHTFTGGTGGSSPQAGLAMDAAGNLYGTVKYTAGSSCITNAPTSCGALFRVAPNGTYTVLHTFAGKGGGDGGTPMAGVVLDGAGNIYGTTNKGGASNLGVIFKYAANGTYSVLHNLVADDGANPLSTLVLDSAGNLYGTTSAKGSKDAKGFAGLGTIFKLTPGGVYTVLYTLRTDLVSGTNLDGSQPHAGVILDASGNLYGTTYVGGSAKNGVVFELSSSGTYTVLHDFTAGVDGIRPYAGLFQDASGNLFGTTSGQGGSGNKGTLFKITP